MLRRFFEVKTQSQKLIAQLQEEELRQRKRIDQPKDRIQNLEEYGS
jgi:hypothetical protein